LSPGERGIGRKKEAEGAPLFLLKKKKMRAVLKEFRARSRGNFLKEEDKQKKKVFLSLGNFMLRTDVQGKTW